MEAEAHGYLWFTRHIINGPQSSQYIQPFVIFMATFVFGIIVKERRGLRGWAFTSCMVTFLALSWWIAYREMGNWILAGLFERGVDCTWPCLLQCVHAGPGSIRAVSLGQRIGLRVEWSPALRYEPHYSRQNSIFVHLWEGLTMAGLIPPEPYWANTPGGLSAHDLKVRMLCFFIPQIFALALERLVAETAKGVMGNAFWRNGFGYRLRLVINLIWISVWFMNCTLFSGNMLRHLGAFRISPVPFSIVNGGWAEWIS